MKWAHLSPPRFCGIIDDDPIDSAGEELLMEIADSQRRAQGLRVAVRLEVFTIAYMVFEALAALVIGVASGSTSLETFGLDSLIELVSGAILLWRLNVEQRGGDAEQVERVEGRAARYVGLTLLGLAVYVTIQSLCQLFNQARPEPTLWGIALALLSLLAMPVLAKLKLRTAARIGSRALHADAYESMACAYLSFTLLLGLGANYLFGWWFADPLASLVMVYFIVREAREALHGE
jgi:cation diffusion facilitator family transporter